MSRWVQIEYKYTSVVDPHHVDADPDPDPQWEKADPEADPALGKRFL